MKKYKPVDVSEKQLEDLIRQAPDLIEEGLRYIDHQRMTDRGPLDILMVDSGNALVVAELKVVEDDTMLVQGVDYYDYVSRNAEGMARAYKDFRVDPNQTIRLFLVAPSFSVSLLNRCKWIDIPISLFAYKCIAFDDAEEIIPVFSEVTVPSLPKPVRHRTIDDNLRYITDPGAKTMVDGLIDEIKAWDPAKILVEPIKDDISLKVSGRVFSYISPRRKHFVVSTYDSENKWTGFPVHQEDDLEAVKVLLKANVEKLGQRRSV
jgi:hypothetical protein